MQVASGSLTRTLKKGLSRRRPMDDDIPSQKCRTVILLNKKLNLCNYFKFMFVRHPFERLVSAWQDKFVDHHG